MNTQEFDNGTMAANPEEGLFAGVYWFYSQFIAGDLDEGEFSDLLDLHIELSTSAAA